MGRSGEEVERLNRVPAGCVRGNVRVVFLGEKGTKRVILEEEIRFVVKGHGSVLLCRKDLADNFKGSYFQILFTLGGFYFGLLRRERFAC